jgi:hypothetical protein
MRGAVAVSANLENIDIIEGRDALTMYQFGTMTAKHFFCCRCGVVTVNDGINHPTDAAFNGPRIDGTLRYERNTS